MLGNYVKIGSRPRGLGECLERSEKSSKWGKFERRPEWSWEPQTVETAQVQKECPTGVVRTSEEAAAVRAGKGWEARLQGQPWKTCCRVSLYLEKDFILPPYMIGGHWRVLNRAWRLIYVQDDDSGGSVKRRTWGVVVGAERQCLGFCYNSGL